jgi:CDP-diglyceride synthetase
VKKLKRFWRYMAPCLALVMGYIGGVLFGMTSPLRLPENGVWDWAGRMLFFTSVIILALHETRRDRQ